MVPTYLVSVLRGRQLGPCCKPISSLLVQSTRARGPRSFVTASGSVARTCRHLLLDQGPHFVPPPLPVLAVSQAGRNNSV
nr:uncharacterized protein LOC112984951 isoform X4 [Dromaius novaehollandiae]